MITVNNHISIGESVKIDQNNHNSHQKKPNQSILHILKYRCGSNCWNLDADIWSSDHFALTQSTNHHTSAIQLEIQAVIHTKNATKSVGFEVFNESEKLIQNADATRYISITRKNDQTNSINTF